MLKCINAGRGRNCAACPHSKPHEHPEEYGPNDFCTDWGDCNPVNRGDTKYDISIRSHCAEIKGENNE